MFMFLFVIFIFILIISNSIKKNTMPQELPRALHIISKIATIICFLIALTMLLDIILPKDILEVNVTKTNISKTVGFGIYSEKLNEGAYTTLKNKEKVKIEVSKIYNEIKGITLIERNNEKLTFPTVDNYAFLFMMVMFLLPSSTYLRRIYPKIINKNVYYVLNIIALVLGMVGIALIIKLFLVHVLHLVVRM